jgi:hypothetical protein
VTEIFEVWPSETWVIDQAPGRDMISLQTCIEYYGDYWTMGPNWSVRYVVRADRVAVTPPDVDGLVPSFGTRRHPPPQLHAFDDNRARVRRRLGEDELNSSELMAAGRDRMRLAQGRKWRILAPLLVLTLLACHGVFGGLHLSVPASVLAGEHPPHHAGSAVDETGGTHDEVPLGGANYAATLFFFLAAVFWLLFGSKLTRVGARIAWPVRGRHRLAVFGYPRGPTLALLQVLRL